MDSVLQNKTINDIAGLKGRIEAVYGAKKQEIEQEWLENNRQHELEQDQFGYVYSAKAGFNSQGYFDVMTVLGHTPGFKWTLPNLLHLILFRF